MMNNSTCEFDNFTFDIQQNGTIPSFNTGISILLVTCYGIICSCGLFGNALVIYVILRSSNMKTVTNMYIVNLAISDFIFLFSMPLLMTTTWLKYWLFGQAMCKIYNILYSINLFTGIFTLTALSADRYLAVCHAIASQRYRTPINSMFAILAIWAISVLVMLPIILYSNTVPSYKYTSKYTCTIEWPKHQMVPAGKAYTWYTFMLGFAIPVSLISIFYILVIIKIQNLGPANQQKSSERRKKSKKVTKMVLTVISVYVICWLPYWTFQVHLTLQQGPMNLPYWKILLFNIMTVLTFTNSMLNPILYAFLSEHFRKGFREAFKCQISTGTGNKSMIEEQSNFEKIKARIKTKQTNVEIDTKTGNISHRVLPSVTDNVIGESEKNHVLSKESHVYDGTDYNTKETTENENSASNNDTKETTVNENSALINHNQGTTDINSLTHNADTADIKILKYHQQGPEHNMIQEHPDATDFKKTLVAEDETDDKNSVTYIDQGSQTKGHKN